MAKPVALIIGCWTELREKCFYYCSFLMHVVQIVTSARVLPTIKHDKSVPYLFSTPQARSQQQTEILIHLLKILAPVSDISGVLALVVPM